MQIDFCGGSWTLALHPKPTGTTAEARCGSRWGCRFLPSNTSREPVAPDDVDTLSAQIVDRLLHIVNFERDHAVAEMLGLRSRVDCGAVVSDQLDGSAAKVQIDQVDRHP